MPNYLSATFGMCEMENAAEQIVDKAVHCGDWNISLVYDEMGDKSGFLQLIYNGWLAPFLLSKKEFGVTQDFINRVTPKFTAIYGPDSLSLEPLMSFNVKLDKRFNLTGLNSPPIGTEPL